MLLIKFSAPLVFDGFQMLENMVLIVDEQGAVESLVPVDDAGDNVQSFDGILCPGFINCHCHLELSHMRGLIPEHTGLIDFVLNVVSQRHFAEAEIAQAIEAAEREMISRGIVAVGDICNTSHTAAQKAKRNLHYNNFVEVSGWMPAVAQARVDNAVAIAAAFTGGKTCLVPHAPYSVSEKLWVLLQPHFANKTVSIHNQETVFEDELFTEGSGDFMRMYSLMKMDSRFFLPSGKSSLQTYFSKLKEAGNVMLVHNTFTKEADVLFAKNKAEDSRQNLFFCLCPNANLYIENALPPVKMLLDNHCTMVFGTDSLASNHSLSILDEMKTLHKHFPQLSRETLLRMATLNGAAALGFAQQLGSFGKGKTPGVLVLDKDFENLKRLV